MNKKNFTLQFKVSLKEIEPEIWRRIVVPATYSFWDLHVAIQDAMGWLDYHLHVFRARSLETREIDEIGIPDDEFGPPFLPGWEIPIIEYFGEPGDRADYGYDFGDDWEHEVVLEKIAERVPGGGRRSSAAECRPGTLLTDAIYQACHKATILLL